MLSKNWSSVIYYTVCFCLFAAALIITIPHRPLMHGVFTYGSYYIILCMTIAWGLCLVDLYNAQHGSALRFIQQHWKGLLASFLLASIVFISVPKSFRVLNDETNLLSVSKSMTFYKNVENMTEGRYYYDIFWPSESTGTEKRPFLFQFFTSLLHTFFGYRVLNAFILNYFVLWAMLFLIYLCIYTSLDFLFVLAGMVLIISQPFIALSATSASFEVFNFTFILASFVALKNFLKTPTAIAFSALVMTLTMLAHVRYESILFFIITMLVLVISGKVKIEYFNKSWALGLVPLFILPLIWQRVLLINEPDPNLTQGSWLHAFSLGHAKENIVLFMKYIFDVSGSLGYAGCVNIINVLAAVVLLVITLRKDWPLDNKKLITWSCAGIGLFALFILVLFYQGGINDHPLNGRFYIPVIASLCLVPVYLVVVLSKNNKKAATVTLGLALAAFAYYHPVAMEDNLCSTLVINREYRYVNEFLERHAQEDSLIIWGTPGQLIVSNRGAISYQTANNDVDNVLQQIKNHLYSNVFVIQAIYYNTKQPFPDNVLDARYQLQTLEERQISGKYFYRISRIVLADKNYSTAN